MTMFGVYPPADVVLERTLGRWDLSGEYPVPRAGWVVCPVCGSGEVAIRNWKYHLRGRSATHRWRCDVNLKCCDCAMIWTHGVAVPQAMYASAPITEHRVDRHGRPFR